VCLTRHIRYYSTPKCGWANRSKDRLQKGFIVNSDTAVLSTWKINKMRLVRMAEKGSKTTLHRGFTESVKKKNILKTIKLTENTEIRKAMAMHWREASDRQEHWLMHWGWLKSDQACTQANICWQCSFVFIEK